MTRLTGWRRFISLNTANARPMCRNAERGAVGDGDAACSARIAAYETANAVLRGEDFREAVLADYLDLSVSTHLTWRAGDTVGKVTALDVEETYKNFGSLGGLLDAIAGIVGPDCGTVGGEKLDAAREDRDDRSYRAMSCQPRNGGTKSSIAFIARPAVYGGIVLIQVNAATDSVARKIWARE